MIKASQKLLVGRHKAVPRVDPRPLEQQAAMEILELFSITPTDVASMGPRLFSHGNKVSEVSRPANWQRLQWGHDFSAMEIPTDITIQGGLMELQWGHDFSAMEI